MKIFETGPDLSFLKTVDLSFERFHQRWNIVRKLKHSPARPRPGWPRTSADMSSFNLTPSIYFTTTDKQQKRTSCEAEHETLCLLSSIYLHLVYRSTFYVRLYNIYWCIHPYLTVKCGVNVLLLKGFRSHLNVLSSCLTHTDSQHAAHNRDVSVCQVVSRSDCCVWHGCTLAAWKASFLLLAGTGHVCAVWCPYRNILILEPSGTTCEPHGSAGAPVPFQAGRPSRVGGVCRATGRVLTCSPRVTTWHSHRCDTRSLTPARSIPSFMCDG